MEAIRDVGPNLKSFYYHVCKPENPELVRGSVLVLHGAEGHGGRYEAIGNELAKQGYAMFAIDHIGHGLTLNDKADDKGGWKKEDLGVWGKDDFELSAYNAYYLVDVIKKTYPGKPVYLLGHDLGGAMAQFMMNKYSEAIDGLIISSCGMPSFKDYRMFLKCLVKKVCLYDGSKSKGTFRSKTAFLNSHFRPIRTKYDWLNSVNEEVDRFIEDPLSGYVGTIGYYYYQYKYIVSVPTIMKTKKVRRDIPILLLGGKEDYIVGRGKQIEKLKRHYERKGFNNIELKLYDRSRHDVLLEWNKEQVAEDIGDFINHNCYKEDFVRNSTNEMKVITFTNDNKTNTYVREDLNNFKEEEPEDDLRISTDIKK